MMSEARLKVQVRAGEEGSRRLQQVPPPGLREGDLRGGAGVSTQCGEAGGAVRVSAGESVHLPGLRQVR